MPQKDAGELFCLGEALFAQIDCRSRAIRWLAQSALIRQLLSPACSSLTSITPSRPELVAVVMAFIATPAFSNLYNGSLLTNATLTNAETLNTTAVFSPSDSTIFLSGAFNPYDVVVPTTAAPLPQSNTHTPPMTTTRRSNLSQQHSDANEKKPILDPFDPAAVVPLPSQLEDQFGPFTTSVWKRNERERYRVRCVNDGYQRLRRHLPVAEDEKRLSKVDTLRLAIRYIKHLAEITRNEMHLVNCRCFDNFTEQSEGHVQIMLGANGRRQF